MVARSERWMNQNSSSKLGRMDRPQSKTNKCIICTSNTKDTSSIVWSNSDCNGMYQLIALHQRFQLHDSANHWSMIVEAELLLLLLDIDMILLDGKVGISFQLTFLHAECTQTIWVSVFSIMYQCVLICSNRHQWLCCRWVSAYFIDYTIVTYGV